MTERRKIALKSQPAARDPHRPRVRPGAPRQRNALAPAPHKPPAAPGGEPSPGPADPHPPRPPARPFAKPKGAPQPFAKPGPKPFAKPGAKPFAKAGAKPGKPPARTRPGPDVEARPARPPAAPPVRRAAEGDGVRVSKWITEQGIASRREADDWIAAGWVRVDGAPAVLGQRIDPARQKVEIDDAARYEQAKRVTILLHKPIGVVSGQPEDEHDPAVALITAASRWSEDKAPIRFQPGQLRHLAPAGRLDIDSTGLLVLTQDGRVAKQLIGDETRVEKEYLVRVEFTRPEPFPESSLALLRHGLTLDGRELKPAQVSWANEDQLRFVLREGMKRQIRRMCEAVGLKVVGLKRVRIGRVPLGKLPIGQWRYLRDDETF